MNDIYKKLTVKIKPDAKKINTDLVYHMWKRGHMYLSKTKKPLKVYTEAYDNYQRRWLGLKSDGLESREYFHETALIFLATKVNE